MGSTKKPEKTPEKSPVKNTGSSTIKASSSGTAVMEKPTTDVNKSVEPPTTKEQYQKFNETMERELVGFASTDVEFLAIAQRHYDTLTEQITKLQGDQAAYRSLLDHFGQAGR